jgi:hypothetical protein
LLLLLLSGRPLIPATLVTATLIAAAGRTRSARATVAATIVTTATIAAGSAVAPITTLVTVAATRLGITAEEAGPALVAENFTLVDPALDSDDTVRGARFSKTVIDVRAEGVQRKLPLEVPLRTGDFGPVQAAGNANLDALAAKPESAVDGFTHRTAEGNALFQLQCD